MTIKVRDNTLFIEQVKGPVRKVLADGAYDTRSLRNFLHEKGIEGLIFLNIMTIKVRDNTLFIEQVKGPVRKVLADGAYDTRSLRNFLHEKGIEGLISLPKNACPWRS